MNPEQQASLRRFRNISLAEGVSYILLLFVAMPLKRFAGLPMAVTVVGWVHGVLFIAYMLFLAETHTTCRWPLMRSFWAVAASLLPFGPFVFERRVLKQEMTR